MFHNGWVNIDILPLQEFARSEAYKFLQWDVKNPLPFDNDSVDLIYSSHFLEHLSYEEGKLFLKDCQRVLKKDGVMRLMVPDLELLKNKYVGETLGDFDEINDESAKCPSQAGKFWKLLFNGHSAAYDWKTLKALANELGFAAAKRNFRQGNLQILQETLDTLPCLSLYVELLKL